MLKEKLIYLIKKIPAVLQFSKSLNNLNQRREFLSRELGAISSGSVILDAGCGSQQFRDLAEHLAYKGQDFAEYTVDTVDNKKKLGTESAVNVTTGIAPRDILDYTGNIWEINEVAESFDAIMCTEVLEHIPYPIETIAEFSRLLKKDGTLILTDPSNCLRHMDPFFFYSGFSDRWFERVLAEHDFKVVKLQPVGDYYRWLAVELWRTMRAGSLLTKLILTPTFFYYYCKRKTQVSTDTLCMGYHVVATKL